ncbi:hypothetical protein PMI14_00346 [Acidovorax sp. CF316]|uniref:hypothetical protein n=1 Tax=Acidovorax sp. CF316 TaxID=1144317 RepID=UPI00026BEBDC|nr:hypothetical protein [Acidovorax sp. CF316]EJE54716.1 hypothetical protein PMI14_00346 [Acidovorax sp. CF316]
MNKHMPFEEQFHTWLRHAMSDGAMPPEVKAYAFNLLEPAAAHGVKFAVELVGTAGFDEDDPDWACDEAWSPRQRQLDIPEAFSGPGWEACLARMDALLRTCLASPKLGPLLQRGDAVALGFVDGELSVLWQRPRTESD